MTLTQEALNSPDRNIRKDFLLQTFQSNETYVDDKLDIFKKGLLDKHDSIRNLSIEYLSSLYEKSQTFDFLEIIMPILEKETVWSVKYLILRKISKFNLKMTAYKDFILKLSFDLKPQVRIATAEILVSFSVDQQDDSVINRLLDLWKDKDESVRKQLEIYLAESKNPKIKQFMAEYEKKLAEKEKRKKDIAGMFEGI